MISLHFEVSQRIKRLVQQDNFSETLCEAEQFAQMNGDETKVVYVASLLDEMGDGKKSRDQINAQKAAILKDEMTKMAKQPQFALIVCKAFENESRLKALQQGDTSAEKIVANLFEILALSLGQKLAVGYALTKSQFRAVAQDALKILASMLPLVNDVNQLKDISEEILHGIVHLISFAEVLSGPNISGSFLNVLRSNGAALSRNNIVRPTIARRMLEIGLGCAATADKLKVTLREIGVPLDEEQVAGIIVAVMPKPGEGGVVAEGTMWNLDVVAGVIAQECRNLNWPLVAQRLDSPALVIRSELEFQVLTRLFVRISGTPMQGSVLVRPWANKAAQLALLILGSKSPRNVVDFSDIVPTNQLMPADVPVPLNMSWASPALYTCFLELASGEFQMEVLEAMAAAANAFPEYVLVGLAQVQDPSSGVRAEILRRVIPHCLPTARPTAMFAIKRLQAVNQDLLVLLFRIAIKRAVSVQELIEVDSRLRTLGPDVVRRVEEEGAADEMLGYWCVRADRSDFNLEQWAAMVLERNPQLARAIATFVKAHGEVLRKRQADGGLLSYESFNILLRALRAYQQMVPAEDMRALATIFQHHQPEMQRHAAAAGQSPAMGNVPGQSPTPTMPQIGLESDTSLGPSLPKPPELDEVEEEANAYFQKIYTSDISIGDVLVLLKRFKTSEKLREQEIFRCMIHNLFDEYRFFHKYPEKELQITGKLFGSLIQHQLVSSITLGIALRYILESIRKNPEEGGSNEKMFRFGKIALENFRGRFSEWPQYCSHLVQIPHFAKHCPELYQDVQKAISNPTEARNGATPLPEGAIPGPSNPVPDQSDSDMDSRVSGVANDSTFTLAQQIGNMALTGDGKSATTSPTNPSTNGGTNPSTNGGVASASNLVPSGLLGDGGSAADIPVPMPSDLPPNSPNMPALSKSSQEAIVANESENVAGKQSIIEKMVLVNVEVSNSTIPPDGSRDQILFIVNNIAKDNCENKTEELRGILKDDFYSWFANYLVVKRISTMPNLHPIYLTVLEKLDSADLFKVILDTTYHNATKLLQSPNITTSSSERSLLRNLGIWLGQITLARNKPLLQRRIDLKELMKWGYENARLIAVCSFVAKIIEGVKQSRIFQPPNPWLMAILSLMRELYEIPDLKMNIKFEVQVLCKNININVEEIPRGNYLAVCKMPVKDGRNPDFTVKNVQTATPPTNQQTGISASPMTPAMAPPMIPYNAGAQTRDDDDKHASAGPNEQTVIPNLASYVTINPSLQFFVQNPAQRKQVSLAVDRAIREIIQPVVERSVTIASVTTKHLVLKDFSSEPNEQQLRSGAHLMISNLAGSLALVTCKEPLRVSISNHLRNLLGPAITDQSTLEQIVQVCANDNLELGCILIEKASTEKAIRNVDVEETFTTAIQSRRKCRETGQPFVDQVAAAAVSSTSKYPQELSDALKPRAGGLHPQQLLVYEAFQRARTVPQAPSTQAGGDSQQAAPNQSPDMKMQQLNAQAQSQPGVVALSMSQALEGYSLVLNRLDMALKTVHIQAQGRDISISMLGGEHEILTYLRDLIIITQRIQPVVRTETAMTFCENVFKRLMDSISVADTLRLEVMIGTIEAIRDACGGIKKFAPDIVSWLGHYASFNLNDETAPKVHRAILLLLLRAKLIRTEVLDVYFATYMDGGRNIVWVELALMFIRQCLSEGLAATYEFANTFDTVSKMHPANPQVKKQLQKWLTELRALAKHAEEQKIANNPTATALGDQRVREHVTGLLEQWLRVWQSINDQVFSSYLQLMHQYGVLNTEEAADKFFRVATELCVEACLKSAVPSGVPSADGGMSNTTLTFSVIDALSKLFLLLVRLADKEAADVTVRVNLLTRILNAVARTLLEDHDAKKAAKAPFDQRPYFRLFSNLSQDLGVPDSKAEPNPVVLPLLQTYCHVYLALQPSVLPGFAFSWLQLISHRTFMPQLLLVKGQKCWPYMHRLMIALLLFLQPFLKQAALNDSIRKLYKGTLRVFLVLLHDFPEFLCDFHLSLCDIIPSTCVQLRNLVLSAFPRSMRLPDPFTPNLKVDLLQEISQAPRILTDYMGPLGERGVRQRLDSYITSKQPADLPSMLPSLIVSTNAAGGVAFNVPLLTSIVVYVGAQTIVQLQSKMPLQNSPSLDIFKQLVAAFDAEGRYHLFNAMANQLRYPNSHTHYFSCILLLLFADAENEAVQEQITRVLLERLIVHRPHPWGLLITFIELIKNPRYAFWRRNFTRCAPEIERVFDSVARSCMGPSAASTVQQQQQGSGSAAQTQGQTGAAGSAQGDAQSPSQAALAPKS